MYKNDLKIFTKNEKYLETLIWKMRIYCQDAEIEFPIEKCAVLTRKSGKRETMEGTEQSKQGSIRMLKEKENYKDRVKR